MSEDEGRKNAGHEEETDEVEAHHGRKPNLANEEAKDEASSDDDFEAHRRSNV